MLANVGAPEVPSPANDVTAIASGIVAEVRADLQADANREGPAAIAALAERLERLSDSVQGALNAAQSSGDISVDAMKEALELLSAPAQAIAQVIAGGGHLTSREYLLLTDATETSDALGELRREGLLVPLAGYQADGTEDPTPVYYFPPGMSDSLQVAALLNRAPFGDLLEVRRKLREVGYIERTRAFQDEMDGT